MKSLRVQITPAESVTCVFAVLSTLIVTLRTESATACSIDPCQPTVTLPMDGAGLPANVSGFLWRKAPYISGNEEPDYALRLQAIAADGTATDVPIETFERSGLLQIVPLAEVAPDTQLAFSYVQPVCGRLLNERVSVSIRVTEPMPQPESLGTLTATEGAGTIRIASVAGDCNRQIVAGYADISLELSDAARPFADVLRYELRVDGELPWRFYEVIYAGAIEERIGASSLGPGQDRVFTPCSEVARWTAALPELARGKHRVRMVGLLPDDSELVSDEIEVELSCEGVDASPSAAPPLSDTERPVSPGACSASAGRGSTPTSFAGLGSALATMMYVGRKRRAKRQRKASPSAASASGASSNVWSPRTHTPSAT